MKKKVNERMSGVVVSPRGTGELDHPYLEETKEDKEKKKNYYPFAYDLLDITLDSGNNEEMSDEESGAEDAVEENISQENLEETSAMAGGAVTGNSGMAWKREDFIQERKLRLFIRERIKTLYKEKILKESLEIAKLRTFIQTLLTEANTEIEDAPHENTGINVLADLLKKIIPTLETDYKILTTDAEQRKSFRAHIVNGIKTSLERLEINKDAENPEIDITEELNIEVDDKDTNELDLGDDEEKFIDIEDKPAPEEESEEDDFSIPGEDETGRNMALQSFEKIDNQITDAYNVLSNEQDKKLFTDYLLTNLKLYFDKFESELNDVQEPTTDEYEAQTTEDDLENELGL